MFLHTFVDESWFEEWFVIKSVEKMQEKIDEIYEKIKISDIKGVITLIATLYKLCCEDRYEFSTAWEWEQMHNYICKKIEELTNIIIKYGWID